MGQNSSPLIESRRGSRFFARLIGFAICSCIALAAGGQSPRVLVDSNFQGVVRNGAPEQRAQRFLRGRALPGNVRAAQAMVEARAQQEAMLRQQGLQPRLSGLSAVWQAVGPAQVASQSYGNVTGRV